MGKFIPKIINFGDLGAVSPHFKSDNGKIWREGGYGPRTPSPALTFVKIAQGICFLGEIFTKNSKKFRDF